jgi:oligosaccharide repeat unit polymerase
MSWTFLYAIDSLALASFLLTYYLFCYRKGFRVDIWHVYMLLLTVLPNMILLPFSAALPNILVLGRDYAAVAAAIPKMFLLTVLGYCSVLAGAALWSVRLGVGLRQTTSEALAVIPRCSMMVMSSRTLLIAQTLLCLGLQACVLAVNWAHEGFNLDLRTYAFANPALRPVVQTTSFYSSIIASHCLARYLDRKERSLLVCNLALAVGLLLFGSRGGLVTIYLNVLLCVLIRMGRRVSLVRVAIVSSVALTFFFYLGQVRAGDYSLGAFFSTIIFLLFYGNNFSDLRDFAWVYACWDHSLWAGRTYLAAMMAFVPRFLSSFRDTWGMGVVTATIAGFDPQKHPGLRPGTFGEGYFNFGVPGVVVVGLLMGILFRKVDLDTKRMLASPQSPIMPAFASTMLINVASTVAVSVNSSTLFVIAAVYLISWLGLGWIRLFRVQPGLRGATPS